jgi:hypothetical protein
MMDPVTVTVQLVEAPDAIELREQETESEAVVLPGPFTVMDLLFVPVEPLLSVAVTVIVNDPADE